MPYTLNTPHAQEVTQAVRNARAAQDMTLAEFGAALGVSHNLIALWERGDREITYERIIEWIRDTRPWVHQLGAAIANVKYAELLAQTRAVIAPEGAVS